MFDDFVGKLRAFDSDAVNEFVRMYDPFIRRTIRRRLSDARLQSIADSVDVCQSAMGSFLIRLAAGQYDLTDRRAMEGLLITIAHRKLLALVRREYADRRDRNRNSRAEASELPSPQGPSVSQVLEMRDVIARALTLLPDHERRLFDLRQMGMSWAEIANAVGESAPVLRKRLSRALSQVALDLGPGGGDDQP